MSDQLESAVPESVSPGSTVLPESPPSRRPGRAVVAVIVLGVLFVCGGVVVLARRSPAAPPAASPRAQASAAAGGSGGEAARRAAISTLLSDRSTAIVSHNRAAFLATLDPGSYSVSA